MKQEPRWICSVILSPIILKLPSLSKLMNLYRDLTFWLSKITQAGRLLSGIVRLTDYVDTESPSYPTCPGIQDPLTLSRRLCIFAGSSTKSSAKAQEIGRLLYISQPLMLTLGLSRPQHPLQTVNLVSLWGSYSILHTLAGQWTTARQRKQKRKLRLFENFGAKRLNSGGLKTVASWKAWFGQIRNRKHLYSNRLSFTCLTGTSVQILPRRGHSGSASSI